MHAKITAIVFSILVLMLPVSALDAATVDGTLKLGGIVLDEDGDESAVQETYNIYDGFSVTQVRLAGTLDPRNYFTLNLREVNLDSRRGDLSYRVSGLLKVTASYDQHRQVFDTGRAVNSDRKDWRAGVRVTPAKWLRVSSFFNYVTREGDRLSFPTGTEGAIGTRYDYSLKTFRVESEARKNRRGIAVAYRASEYIDELNDGAERLGQVISGRLFTPCIFYDKWTHLVRVARGARGLTNSYFDHTMTNFQYTGVVRPDRRFQFKYHFDANRVDDESTDLKTDRFANDVDVTVFHKYGQVMGGYGYESNNDDDVKTHYNSWRVGTTFRYDKRVTAKLNYAGRVKKDEEDLTLLRDVEATRFRGNVQITPADGFVIGGGYSIRQREFPDIDVKADGQAINGNAHYTRPEWGGASVDYTYSKDEYTDLESTFDASSSIVTGRLDFEKISDVRLSGGATYLDVGDDLDIQKVILFIEGMYTVMDDYHLEVKYNRYDYDDMMLLSRDYTANVVWINVAYDLHVE